jgi:hypothetical protein
MFRKRKWYQRGRGRIESDEGFSVFVGRDAVTYREDGREMTITVDSGAGRAVVFKASIGRWDDDPARLVDDETRTRIQNNVGSVLEWLGWNVRFQ